MSLAACGSSEPAPAPETNEPAAEFLSIQGTEDGVLTVGMECQYAPYNWTQLTDANGAVEIANNPGAYANGYDVMIAQKICEKYGWKLEVMALEWGGLTPALNAGTIDVAIAGQSMTAERMAEVDMAGPYYYAEIVCLTTKDNANASVTSVAELTDNCTAQSGTIWYNSCLPQATKASIQAAAETAPAMIMALESGTADFICTDMPTATAAVAFKLHLCIGKVWKTKVDKHCLKHHWCATENFYINSYNYADKSQNCSLCKIVVFGVWNCIENATDKTDDTAYQSCDNGKYECVAYTFEVEGAVGAPQ